MVPHGEQVVRLLTGIAGRDVLYQQREKDVVMQMSRQGRRS